MSATKYHHHHTIEAALRGQIKERPILFSTDMVRAILEGRKTQTRRIMDKKSAEWMRTLSSPEVVRIPHNGMSEKFGYPGDYLWVRETWLFDELPGFPGQGSYHYKANGYTSQALIDSFKGHWRPSIHMPRAAARILLEITDIRAQRLQEITETDAIAEGINSTTQNGGPNKYYDNYHTGRWMEPAFLNNPILSYQTLWETINGPHSWAANPWVWAITFKKIG